MKTKQKEFNLNQVSGDILNFSGKTIFKYVQEIGNNVLTDQFCPNTVQITFLEDQRIRLFITELGVCGGRRVYAYGQISPSGIVIFEYAVPVITLPDGTDMKVTDVITGHLGGTISGQGIDRGTLVFNGKFDGHNLKATTHFILKCEVEWPSNNIFPTPVNGPIQCLWTYDLVLD